MCRVAEGVSGHRAGTIRSRFAEYGCLKRFELIEIVDSSHVLVRCRECGNTFTRHTTFLNESKDHNIECRSCGVHADGSRTPPQSENKRGMDESAVVEYYKRGNSATQTALKFGMNLRRVRRIIDEAGVSRDRQAVLPLDDYPDGKSGDEFFDEELTCAECGRAFTRFQRMKLEGTCSDEKRGAPMKYCSNRCSTRHRNKLRKKPRKRLAAYKTGDVIPLGDLVERDGGVCQICGEPVDFDDGFFDSDAHFHMGRKYPTVDHIIPVSKGGQHVWGNVQLAHQSCNSAKCDKL